METLEGAYADILNSYQRGDLMKNVVLALALSLATDISSAQSSFLAGGTDFNTKDRLAITNVIHAYAFHWDSGDVDEFLSLCTDDADYITYGAGGAGGAVNDGGVFDHGEIKDKSAVQSARDRTAFFQKNQMQRRHIMSSTLFMEQTSDTAEVIQYCLLITTDSDSQSKSPEADQSSVFVKTKIVSPIVYRFEFAKLGDTWKIRSREINLDSSIDVP